MHDILSKLTKLSDTPTKAPVAEKKQVLNENAKTINNKYKQFKSDAKNLNESAVKEEQQDESALQAYLGKKKYGEKGMKALQQAGREGASKEKMAKIRAQHDKMDEQQSVAEADGSFSIVFYDAGDDVYKTIAKGQSYKNALKIIKNNSDQMYDEGDHLRKISSNIYVHEPDYKNTGERASANNYKHMYHWIIKPEASGQVVAEGSLNEKAASPEVAKVAKGMSKKAAKDYASTKHKGLPDKVKEDMMKDPSERLENRGEYDQEGEMARSQLRTIQDAATELKGILDADDNLPEWVQSKITKAMDYLDTARDYMQANPPADKPFLENMKVRESFNKHRTINSLIKEAFDEEKSNLNLDEDDLKDYLGDNRFIELQNSIIDGKDLPEDLKSDLFNYYKEKGEVPPEIVNDPQKTADWLTNKLQNVFVNSDTQSQEMKEGRVIKGRAYGGAAQADDEDDEDGEPKVKQPAEKRGRGRPRKNTNPVGDSGKAKYGGATDLQKWIVGNVPKSTTLSKLPSTKHKMKG